jgi:hypothetical protein
VPAPLVLQAAIAITAAARVKRRWPRTTAIFPELGRGGMAVS